MFVTDVYFSQDKAQPLLRSKRKLDDSRRKTQFKNSETLLLNTERRF